MGEKVNFDYFYGGQSDGFSYYRIPRLLITAPQFKSLSTDAKLLYGLLLDRMGLSSRNGWYDELGRVYIYYSLDEIQRDLNCGHEKAVKLLAELDAAKGIGLIDVSAKDKADQQKFMSSNLPHQTFPSSRRCHHLRLRQTPDFRISEVKTSEYQKS